MSKVYFTSDWHFGHKAILKYRPEFESIEQHDQTFIDNFNNTVTKRDTVYFLGDMAFTAEGLEKLKQLRHCHKKVLYLGNHDTLHTREYLEVFDEVFAIRSLKNFWLSHCPMHPQEIRNRKGNIHGHLHRSVLGDSRYFDVSPEKHNYELVDFEYIKEYFILNGKEG
jgi:calcineurin-like phosphoesterase family protein